MSAWSIEWVQVEGPEITGTGDLWSEAELAAREASAGIRANSPFMIDPQGAADPVMTAYFNSARFTRLREATIKSYVTDYKLFFNFLWRRRELRWLEATVADVEDYEYWRIRAPNNPRPISGGKWVRELAALKRLYDWAVSERLVESSPIRTVTVRRRDGSTVESAELRTSDVRNVDMKWLTPRMARVWRDIGLRGLTRDGLFDLSFRGRNADRNSAFFDLLFDSGLRRTEAASMLTIEVPHDLDHRRYGWGSLSSAVAKYGSGRKFPVTGATLSRIRAYESTSRATTVAEAQAAQRYEQVRGKRLVERVWTTPRGTAIQWIEENTGQVREALLNRVGVRDRMKLFTRTSDGIEPLWLWLAQDGMPFQPHSWEDVFASGTARCKKVLGDEAPYCTPHMARHSFALIMLVALLHVSDERYGLTPEQRRDYGQLYGDPWRMVKDLLGHQSVETTRNIYLAPVRDVQIQTLLEDDMDYGTQLLHALARLSTKVQDVSDGE